jgi:hypothetical protein
MPLSWTRRLFPLILLSIVWFICWGAMAQQVDDTQQLQPIESPPPFGTFYTIGSTIPYPFDPYFGQLPVYQWKPGVYIVDDSQVDGGTKLSSTSTSADGGGMMTMDAAPPPPCDPCSTNGEAGDPIIFPPAYNYDPTNLWLEIAGITNNQAFFVVHTPDTFGGYDLFSTTNLALTTNVGGLNRTNWVWLMRTATSQTNLVLTNLWPSEGWFQLGTMLDTDNDSLPDAFENVVSKTNPYSRDSDSDGIEDGDENGPNGLPWRLEQDRRSAAVVYATTPTATEGGSCGQVTVYLPTPAPTGGATIQYHVGGNAVPGSEFTTTPSGNSLTIAAGNSSGTITICAVNDSAYADLNRYVEITLTNASSCAVDSRSARVALIDNDPPEVRVFAMPQWVRKPSKTFGTNTAAFYFIRDGNSVGSLTASFNIGGTAQVGVDYDFISSSITFPEGVRTNLLLISLKPTTNTADKTLSVTLSSVPGYQIDPTLGSATMTIASSTLGPLPVIQVTATDDDAREPNNTGTFTLTRTGSTAKSLRVFYHVSGTAQAGSTNSARDYLELPGYVDFGVGVPSVPVTVTPVDDAESETVETVIVTIAGGDYAIGAASRATVYIDDNEPVSYYAKVIRPGVHGVNTSRVLYGRVTRYGTALSAASAGWTLTYTLGASTLTGVFPGRTCPATTWCGRRGNP